MRSSFLKSLRKSQSVLFPISHCFQLSYRLTSINKFGIRKSNESFKESSILEDFKSKYYKIMDEEDFYSSMRIETLLAEQSDCFEVNVLTLPTRNFNNGPKIQKKLNKLFKDYNLVFNFDPSKVLRMNRKGFHNLQSQTPKESEEKKMFYMSHETGFYQNILNLVDTKEIIIDKLEIGNNFIRFMNEYTIKMKEKFPEFEELDGDMVNELFRSFYFMKKDNRHLNSNIYNYFFSKIFEDVVLKEGNNSIFNKFLVLTSF